MIKQAIVTIATTVIPVLDRLPPTPVPPPLFVPVDDPPPEVPPPVDALHASACSAVG